MFYGIKHELSIAKWLGSLVVSILAHGGLGLAVVAGSIERPPLKYISRDVDVALSVPRLAPPPPALHGVRPQRTTPSTTPRLGEGCCCSPVACRYSTSWQRPP